MEIYLKKWQLSIYLMKYIAMRIPNFMKLCQISSNSCGGNFVGMTMIICANVLSIQTETKYERIMCSKPIWHFAYTFQLGSFFGGHTVFIHMVT